MGAFYLIIGIIRNKNYDLGNMFDIFGSFGNVFGFLAPVAGLNATFFLYSRSVLGRLQSTIATAKFDKDRLKGGRIDPRYFYERCAEALREAKSFEYLENLNGDTSNLTVKEKVMLKRFRDE